MRDLDEILDDVLINYPTILDLSMRTANNKVYVSIWYLVKDEFEHEKTYDELVYELEI